jgi:hypothetical protein
MANTWTGWDRASGSRGEMTRSSESATTGPPSRKRPRGTIGTDPSPASGREPVQFVIEDAPQMTPDVAAALARIVRSLRDHQKGEAA